MALTMLTTVAIVPLAPAAALAGHRVPDRVCDIPWTQGKRQVKKLIRCAARRWEVPGGPRKALSVARCESGFNPAAYGGGNAGVYQQRIVYWPGRAKRWGFRGWRVYNGRANAIVSIRMAHAGGWGPWSCA